MSISFLVRFAAAIIVSATVASPAVPESGPNKKNTDSIVPVEVIVVTATTSKRRISETPANVSVITKSEIKASPAKTIEDLLSTQTNVQPIRSVAIGEGIPSDISMRGIPGALAASRTLILVDGIPTNASGTPFLIVNEVPMEAIDRIEIVRGPNSSLYGANALGGVINILTQDGHGKPKGDFVAETSYPFSIADRYNSNKGSLINALDSSVHPAYWNVNATVNGGTDNTGLLVSAGYKTIGNYLLRDYAIARDGDSTYPIKNVNYNYEEFRIFGKAKLYTTDNNSISLNIRYFKSALGFGMTRNIIPDSQDVETKGQKFLIGPQLKISLSDNILLRAAAFYRSVIGEFQNEGIDSAKNWVPSYWKSQTNDGQIESQVIINLGTSNVVTSGIELLSNNAGFGATINPETGEILPNSFSTDKGIVNGAFFVQDEIKFFDRRLNIVPVVRTDYHSVFGSALSPKLGINYKILDQLRFRTSIGRSFRAPSLAELFMPDLVVNPDYVVKCNPNLKPEYLVGWDGGVEAQVCQSLTLKCDVYFNTMKDLISETVVLDSTRTYVTHRNISNAWSDGIENELQWRPVPWFWFSANNTLQNSLDEYYREKLDYVPNYTFGCRTGFTRQINSILSIVTLAYRQVGPRSYLDFTKAELLSTPEGQRLKPLVVSLPAYHTVDASLKFSFSHYSITFTGQNIFNAAWEEEGGTLSPGRFASMKLGVSF